MRYYKYQLRHHLVLTQYCLVNTRQNEPIAAASIGGRSPYFRPYLSDTDPQMRFPRAMPKNCIPSKLDCSVVENPSSQETCKIGADIYHE